jgi:hypothetical protein
VAVRRFDAMGAVDTGRARAWNEDAMTTERVADEEAEVGRSADLVGEIVRLRGWGNRDPIAGTSDDDLLGAIEELESAIRDWRSAR